MFYEVYKQCYHWLNEKLTRAEQFSPLAKSDMKSVKIEMEQLKVTSLCASIMFAHVLMLVCKLPIVKLFLLETIRKVKLDLYLFFRIFGT